MKAELFLEKLQEVYSKYPKLELTFTDELVSVGTFETAYCELCYNEEKRQIWFILDTENGSSGTTIDQVINALISVISVAPGCDVLFEDCFSGKNTFETYIEDMYLDDENNTFELLFNSSGSYDSYVCLYGIEDHKEADRNNQTKIKQYKDIQTAGNVLCSFCELNQCESCIVTLLVDQARSKAGIDPCSEFEVSNEDELSLSEEDPAIMVCEYETDERYFVYDSKDNCVSSNGFHFEDEAISYANRNGYPTVKVHRYYIDSDRGGKLYPDGEPEIVWKEGNPI